MPSNFRCTIVTPERAVFDEEITYASIPAWDGQHGVLGGQSPLLTQLGIGGMTIEAASGSRAFFVEGGFAQVRRGHLTIVTERAMATADLDAAEAEADLRAANDAARAGGSDQAKHEAAQQSARARRALAVR